MLHAIGSVMRAPKTNRGFGSMANRVNMRLTIVVLSELMQCRRIYT